MKSLAQQNASELGGRLSVLNRQKQDHIKLDRLLHRLGDASDREHGRVLRSIYRLVFPHAFAEEAVLWPVMRGILPDGHALTLRVEQEHQEINQWVTRLESLNRGSPGYQEVLGRVVALLRADVRDEEDALLPRLQARLSPAQLQLLGLAWEAVRWIAPTRAHPVVARRLPGNWFSALPLAVVDRFRDFADSIADGRRGPATAPLRTLSSGLSRVSHGIEQLPGMRRGEDASTRVGGGSPVRWTVLAVVSLAAASGALLAARRR